MKKTGVHNLKTFGFAVVLTVATHSPSALAWPRMEGEIDNAQCQQAYKLAVSVFQSANASPFAPIIPPENLGSTPSLYTTALDISGGSALSNDPMTFAEQTPSDKSYYIQNLYWQIKPQLGKRWVILDQPFNWRGDLYSLYSIDEDVTPDLFTNDLQREISARTFQPILGEAWRPPLVLTNDASGQSWAIDLDAGAGALPRWSVYATGADGTRSRCVVNFMPKVRRAAFLMPETVQRFHALLDEALGPGTNEGTLHPTLRIRGEVDLAWANAALRPWALTEDPYNTHQQVDTGLQEWSNISPKHRAVYRAIQRQYPKAKRSLSRYYRRVFRLSPNDSRKMARYVADTMFREYFVFSGGQIGWNKKLEDSPNPWTQLHHLSPGPADEASSLAAQYFFHTSAIH